MKKVVVIVGPTASGKTALSVQIAKQINAEIINGDSVQVYQGLNIGSAKITDREKEGVKHHLLDIRHPSEPYTVYDFQKDARALIETIERPMIVGGTGLYIQAALYDYEFEDEMAKKPSFLEQHQDLSNQELYDKLLQLDPNIKIDVHNRRRLLRALEMALSGILRSDKKRKDIPLYDLCILYLDVDRKYLEERLHVRLDQQLAQGFLNEVKQLSEQNIVLNMIGYREIHQYLIGAIDEETMKRQIIKKTKLLAKRQKTWFKNQMRVHLLNITDPNLEEQALNIVEQFYKEESS